MNPNNSLDNLLEQGHLQLERGQYEEGLQVFQQADSLFPNNAEVKSAIGLAHYRLEQYEDCIQYTNLALQLKQIYPLALVRRGMAYKALEQTELANADFESVLRIKPQNNEDWRARGIVFDELKRSEEALQCYDKILKIEANSHQSWHNKGLTLVCLKRYEKALECFNKALEILPDKFFSLRSRCGALSLLQRYQEAMESCSQALKLKPQDFLSLRTRGIILFWLGKLEPAIAYCDRALEIKPNDVSTWYWKAEALARLQEYETALSCYDKVLEINVDFLMRIFQTIGSNANQKQIYLLFEQNLDKLNLNLAQALQIWTERTFPTLKPEQKQTIGYYIIKFGTLIQQFSLGNRYNNLETAITSYNTSLTIFSKQEFPLQWALIQNNLGLAYSSRIEGNKAKNIELAISAYQQALIIRTKQDFPSSWAKTQKNLGIAYDKRIEGNKAENIELAISAYQQALTIYTQQEFPIDWASTQNSLGATHSIRIKGDKKQNIEDAIFAYQQALIIRTQQDFPIDWAMTQLNLGAAYSERIKGDKAENIENAIASFQRALIICTQQEFPINWASIQNNIGIAYLYRIKGDKAENIENAIASCQQALIIYTQQDFPIDWAMTQNNIGIAYLYRIKGDKAENIELAISVYKQALIICTQQDLPIDWTMTQNNLGAAYSERIKGDKAKNIENAIAFYQRALIIRTQQDLPLECLQTARNLGNLYFNKGSWQLAIDAYTIAIKAVEQRREWASNEQNKQEIISDAIEVYQNIVRACINLRQVDKAIEYIERGKARNLVDLLANRDLYPKGDIPQEVIDRLDALRQEAIVEERRLSQQRSQNNGFGGFSGGDNRGLGGIVGNDEVSNRDRLNQIRIELNSLVKEHIQPVDHSFQLTQKVEPISFEKIKAALPTEKTVLIEWFVGNGTLSTFIVTRHQKIPVHFDYSEEEFGALSDVANQYYDSYREGDGQWRSSLPSLLTQLAQSLQIEKIVEQIKQFIPDCDRLILVPHRWLHLLPIHALPLSNSKCLLDLFPNGVSYAPSVQLLQLTQKQNKTQLTNLFAIENPTEDSKLKFTSVEVAAIRSQFKPNDYVLKGKEGYRQALTKERLAQTHCTHFSCHGVFNFERPELSALLLANSLVEETKEQSKTENKEDETKFLAHRDGKNIDLEHCLTLGKIFSLDLRNCRLVTLSACETGLTDFRSLSDEYIGLPSGFLYAGSPSVVSSLWAVSDLSTTFLMIKFYQNLREIDSVPIALNQAQLWLRDLTKEELAEWKTTLDIGWQMYKIDQLLINMPDNSRPFASPYHWAAFCSVGS